MCDFPDSMYLNIPCNIFILYCFYAHYYVPFIRLIIQLNSGKVVAVGGGGRDRDGKVTPIDLKEGEVVLLPEYGGTEVKLADKE